MIREENEWITPKILMGHNLIKLIGRLVILVGVGWFCIGNDGVNSAKWIIVGAGLLCLSWMIRVIIIWYCDRATITRGN